MKTRIRPSRISTLLALSVLVFVLLNACQSVPATTSISSLTPTPSPTKPALPTLRPCVTPSPTPPDIHSPTLTPYDRYGWCDRDICIRWFVNLGFDTDESKIVAAEEVAADYNRSQDKIKLLLETAPNFAAREILRTEIEAGTGPDIIGPLSWYASNAFYGQWLDLAPYLKASGFDTSIFDPELVKAFQTEEGQAGLPFATFPGGMFFVPALFDKAGLAYPPQKYGKKYELDGKLVDWNWATVTKVAKRLTLDKNGKNATEAGFDKTQIVQVGYSPQWQSAQSMGAFYGGASLWYSGSTKGKYKAVLPKSWREAWQWYYEGMWGKQPFIATGSLAHSPLFGCDTGNVFASGKAAMALTQAWYTCCLADFTLAGNEFQIGIQPMGQDGQVHGRVDADTFHVWKGTHAPEAAVAVLSYLITTGADKLLPIYYPAYNVVPPITSKTEVYVAPKSKDYLFVTQASWEVFLAGLAYPDAPSAESWAPNFVESDYRLAAFKNLMDNTPPGQFDFELEFRKLEDDLTVIFNK